MINRCVLKIIIKGTVLIKNRIKFVSCDPSKAMPHLDAASFFQLPRVYFQTTFPTF